MSLAADLSLLPLQSLDGRGITAHIASRYHQGIPFSTISTRVLVAMNTFSEFDVNQDKVFRDFAARTVNRLQCRSESQVVVFLGEHGSGKTEFCNAFTRHVLTLAGNPLSIRIRNVQPLLEAFGTAKSASSAYSSKMGLIHELQYDKESNLIGFTLLDYRLERRRVTHIPTNERNYHIFYYMVNGLTEDERYHLQLSDVAQHRYRYLGHPSQLRLTGVDDGVKFKQVKSSLYALGFTRPDVANIFQVLAAILHIGQLQFRASASDSSVAQTAGVQVVNTDILELIASFLGVLPNVLTTCLISKTVSINKDRVTVVLDERGARENADEVARTLYTLLTSWILEKTNSALSMTSPHAQGEYTPMVDSTLTCVDFPGFSASPTGATLDRLLHNTANEMLYGYMLYVFFLKSDELLSSEDVEIENTEYFDNSETIKDLTKPRIGVLSVIDDYATRDKDNKQLLEGLSRRFEHSETVRVSQEHNCFTVNHFSSDVEYSTKSLVDDAKENISSDIISLFVSSSSSDFLKNIFQQSAVVDDTFGAKQTVVSAHLSSEPKRQHSVVQRSASLRRSRTTRYSPADDLRQQGRYGHSEPAKKKENEFNVPRQFIMSLDKVIDSFEDCNPYFVLCLKPNDNRLVSSIDARCVRQQATALGIAELAKRTKYTDHSVFMYFNEYLSLATNDPPNADESEREHVARVIEAQGWPSRDLQCGTTGVFLSENAWLQLVDPDMTFADAAAQKYAAAGGEVYKDQYLYRDIETKSLVGGFSNMFRYAQDPRHQDEYIHVNEKDLTDVKDLTEPVRKSTARRNWLAIVWLYTWWVPDFLVRTVGKIPYKSVRTAWREKLAINLIIWGMCAGCMLFLIGLPYLVCPLQDVMTAGELSGYSTSVNPTKVYTAIRGIIYDITKFSTTHYPPIVPAASVARYGGKDSSDIFPIQVSAVCGGVNGTMSEFIVIGNPSNYTDDVAQYHDFRSFTNDSRPDWYLQKMEFFNRNYLKGYLGYTPEDIQKKAHNKKQAVASLDGYVYDLSDYVNGNIFTQAPAGFVPPIVDTNFMDQSVADLFQSYSGQDISKRYHALNLDDNLRFNMDRCLKNVFLMGKLDTRGSSRCLFARYFLLAVTCFVVSIIVVKFVAALQFGSFEYPDDLDKFVICQIPAYTEDETSLRRAIDSLARTKYDDKRKLLVVICDGMIVGAGNEKSTPRIVLDILGCPEEADPPALSFQSLGEGEKQHNLGKLYTGLYEVGGHIVPYVVIVKVGKPTETFRPGNRGKRDSQMILMRFLNRVHYNSPMSPLELELYYQIQEVIGVNPAYYEFILQVDADTVVSRESLSQMVGKMVRDNKIQGLCGETSLSNARHSIITMMQVYEYYISHNLAKAFESLFGTVTCLPGCFTLYRLFEQRTGRPIFVSNPIVEAYAQNKVDTLHTKNLLHLGEDRYLTTLLLKFNPTYSTKFLRHAQASTIAPDSWSILLSQRRRWINSTVHNFVELLPMTQMCGCCIFSMRFVVVIDLLSTLIQPVTCGYLAYLVYLCVTRKDDIPYTSIAMVAAIYGLQAVVFILRRRWEMVGWMLVFILALPIHSFALPLYAFWYMDDFSWGNTRLVLGEKGEKLLVNDDGHFDPSDIPLKRWTDYHAENWEKDLEMEDEPEGTSVHPQSQSQLSAIMSSQNSVLGAEEVPLAMEQQQPSDTDLTEAIREILATADLSKVTKKTIRLQLENEFNCNLSMRRAYISSVTEALLAGEL